MFKLFEKIVDYLRYGNKKDGLIDEVDERNFGSRAIYTPKREDLVDETFIVFNPTPLDQYDSDFCVGYGGAYVAEATEGRVCSGAYLFAMAKKLSGEYLRYGTSILKMCRARQKFGVCKKELYDYKKGKRNYYANWENIPQEAHEDAGQHKSKAYFALDIPWGWTKFDAIRANLWHFRDKKVLIDTGNNGHKITIIGYDKPKNALIAQDTYGDRTFNKGIRFIGEWEANRMFTPYFQIDMARALAELLVQYNGKAVKLKDDNECYLIYNSKKRHLKNEVIAWAHNTLLFDPNFVYEISKENFDKIPTGEPAKFKDGKNWQIVQRILERTNNTNLINE